MPIPYYHVDSFTDQLFAGNPAGVCILRAFPSDSTLLKIAAENRHSETAFVVARQDGDFDLRWFTPQVETDLCGHATLAAAHVLALRKHEKWPVKFYTLGGILTVARDQEWFELDFPVRLAEPCQPPSELLPALGLKTASVMRSVRDYLVIVGEAECVRSLSPNNPDLAKVETGIGGPVVTAPGEGDADYVCRYFAPCAGIAEDPATGSIQCTLVPYWAERLGKQTLHGRQLSARGAVFECTLADNRVKIKSQARLYLQGMIEA
jgi:predicted PhzF superfamily epimerase YddE/YHI9